MSGLLKGYLLEHWRGSLPLWQMLVINLFAVRLGFTGLAALAGDKPGTALRGTLITGSLGLLLWQSIGAVRRARRDMGQGDLFAGLASYAAVLMVVFMTVFQVVDLTFQYQPAPYVSPFLRELSRSDDGRGLIVSGPIDYPLNTALKAAIAKQLAEGSITDYPVERVDLTSEGGSIFAARALALNIQKAGLETRAVGWCYSACIIAFIAGKNRSLAKGAVLGFHGYRFDMANRVQTFDVNEEEAKDREFFLRQGLPEWFISRIFATPPEQLWRPERAELVAAGVIAY